MTSIACNLNALDADQQRRRAALADALVARAATTRETADGYALEMDAALLRDAAEWITLERLCCPFLRFELRFDSEMGSLRLSLGGGAGVKEFLTVSGLRERSSVRGCCA